MNTFAQAGALVPVARYDPRYARALGKWMLNLTNAARLFYPGALPLEHESSADWSGDPSHVIAYEGLRRVWRGKSPFATGDPVVMNWGPKTDLGIYGSATRRRSGGDREADRRSAHPSTRLPGQRLLSRPSLPHFPLLQPV